MALPPGYPLNAPPVFDMGLILSGTGQTTTTSTADICNNVFKGITITLNVTAITAGSIQIVVQGKDSVSGGYFALLTATAVTATTANPVAYTIYPGIAPTSVTFVSGILPAFFRVQAIVTTGPCTYTVGASLTT